MMGKSFNPLDKSHLGESVAKALLAQPVLPLPPLENFSGAGIYALYYMGNFVPYAKSAEKNRDSWEIPIYVGKAVPPGARNGNYGIGEETGDVLFKRLREHAESIRQVKNLFLEDFRCRYLVVDDIWIPLGESLIIAKFQPLWNQILDGFGNHDPGKGRYNQQNSPWDTVHPGRAWAAKLIPNSKSLEDFHQIIASAPPNYPVI